MATTQFNESRVSPTQPRKRGSNKKKKSSMMTTLLLYTLFWLFLLGSLFSAWFFLTSSGTELRFMMADTLITTQHRHWAKYFIGQAELDRRVKQYQAQFESYSDIQDNQELVQIAPTDEEDIAQEMKEPVTLEVIARDNFKGYLLYVHDPKSLRIGVPGKAGKGEKVSSMAARLDAIAGVNGGGFVDPEWKGNGFQPIGIVMSGGELFYNDGTMDTPNHIVGIDKDGKLIAGKYTPNQLLEMGMREAVTFTPKFIVNGKGMIKSQKDGWGIAPRTCIGQTADGTIIFAIIDGRQPGHSIGATLYDIQQLFLEKGVVTAANMDGGSSTVLVHQNEIKNRPASEYGERYLPTAWLVFENPEQADIRNVWEGLRPEDIDPSKW